MKCYRFSLGKKVHLILGEAIRRGTFHTYCGRVAEPLYDMIWEEAVDLEDTEACKAFCKSCLREVKI